VIGGTLIVSRAVNLHSRYKMRFEQLGYENVTVTGVKRDGLNMLINKIKPRLLIMGSDFYLAGTPYMTGELHALFPDLYIGVVSVHDYPLRLAPWFIWHGANAYASLWEGYEEFHRGLQIIRTGRQYISPKVKTIIEMFDEWPDTSNKITKREMECLILLCCGFVPDRIADVLHIARSTVNCHLVNLYNTFHVQNREEMIALAWELEMVSKKDIRFYNEKKNKLGIDFPEWAVFNKKAIRKMRKEDK